SDYYTQDKAGNVWYFGEDTAELDASGKVTSRGHVAHGPRRREGRHLHARAPAHRPDRPAGVLQGPGRGSLPRHQPERHRARAVRVIAVGARDARMDAARARHARPEDLRP